MRGYSYDLLGRLTQAGFGAASTTSPVYDSTIGYSYDAGNRVTQIADSANGTITRTYDERFDAVTLETTPQGSVAYCYDAAGRRATQLRLRRGGAKDLGGEEFCEDGAARCGDLQQL